MSGDLIEAEKQFEVKALKAENAVLKDEVKELQKEIDKLRILLKEVDPDAEASMISDPEYICLTEIKKLRDRSAAEDRDLTMDEVKSFDILHKNLMSIQAKNPRKLGKGKVKTLSAQDLEEIIKGS